MTEAARPPETVEGWYALHQMLRVDRAVARATDPDSLRQARASVEQALHELGAPIEGGWSAPAVLIGSNADVMLVHFRPTLESLRDAQQRLAHEPLFDALRPVFSFLSVTEAPLRGAPPLGVDERLYPALPVEMPYVCFYPMGNRRDGDESWYALAPADRSRVVAKHDAIGRAYRERVMQVITAGAGLDRWEWGVTLFARDPLDFKRFVTDLRGDDVSARYAAFGEFFVGKVVSVEEWLSAID